VLFQLSSITVSDNRRPSLNPIVARLSTVIIRETETWFLYDSLTVIWRKRTRAVQRLSATYRTYWRVFYVCVARATFVVQCWSLPFCISTEKTMSNWGLFQLTRRTHTTASKVCHRHTAWQNGAISRNCQQGSGICTLYGMSYADTDHRWSYTLSAIEICEHILTLK